MHILKIWNNFFIMFYWQGPTASPWSPAGNPSLLKGECKTTYPCIVPIMANIYVYQNSSLWIKTLNLLNKQMKELHVHELLDF